MKSILSDRFAGNGLSLGGVAPYPVHPDLVPAPALPERTDPAPPVPPQPRSFAGVPVRYLVKTGDWSLDYVWGRRGRAKLLHRHHVVLITPEWVYVRRRDSRRRLQLDRHSLERDGLVTRTVDGETWTFRHPGWPCRDKGILYRDLPDSKRADGLRHSL